MPPSLPIARPTEQVSLKKKIKKKVSSTVPFVSGWKPDTEETERVTGRKARGLQMEEIACKCQTFLSLLSSRRKQTSNIFSSIQI